MAMTTAQRTDAYRFFAIAFNAAPGATYMSQLYDAYTAGMTTQQIVNVYTTKPQFLATYPTYLSDTDFATKLVNNIVKASATDAAKAQAVSDIVASLGLGQSRGDVIYTIFNNLANKLPTDADWGATAKQMANQVVVAQYYTETLVGDSTNLATLQSVISNVTNTSDVSTSDKILALIPGGVVVGQTYTLTTGVDTIAGGANNDTINASWNTTATNPLGGLDSIDGGAGTDSLNIADNATATTVTFSMGGATVKNVENVTIATSGTLGTLGTALDLTGLTGATSLTLSSQDSGAVSHEVSVEDTAALAVTVAAGTVKTTGGKSVSVTGGTTLTINDSGAAALTSVSVSKLGGAATATGDAITSLTVGATAGTAARLVTVSNTTAGHTLNVTSNGAGYNAAGTEYQTKVYDAAAKVMAITATAKSSIEVGDNSTANSTLTTVTLAGAGNVKLNLDSTRNTAVTAYDGSAATGNQTLANVAAATVSVKTGSGKDTLTTTQTTKAAFDMGAGNDTVTVASALAAGTTIALGAGDDKLLYSSGSIANSTSTATTVVDGGDGTDTLALALVGAANVGVFQNFEVFDVIGLNNGAGGLDMNILAAKNTITGVSGSGALGGASALINLGAGVNFTASADMGTATALTLTQTTGGALTVKLDADSTDDTTQNDTGVKVIASNATALTADFNVDSAYNAPLTNTNDQTIDLTGTKAASLTVVSGGTLATNKLVYASATNGASSAADILTAVTVTGSQDLTVDYTPYAAGKGNTATFDASAFTGKLSVDTNVLKNGGTLKLGSGTDTVWVGDLSNPGAGAHAEEAIVGFTKSTSTTSATAIAAADKLIFDATANNAVVTGATKVAVAVVTTAASVTGGAVDTHGVVTFTGAGPANLDAAVAIAGLAAGGVAGNAVVFEYVGDTYVFVEGAGAATAVAATDHLVKLVGVTGVTSLNETGTDVLYIA